MRIGIVSDVHGNLTALEAVIEDLTRAGTDVVVNAGDLVGTGPRPAEVIDRVVGLGWPGVVGNTDEVLWKPEPLKDLAAKLPTLKATWDIVFDDVARTQAMIGQTRTAWLRELPAQCTVSDVSIVHASPGNPWKAPAEAAPDEDLVRAYAELQSPVVVYGHIHVPFYRGLPGFVVANAGSVGLPYDGDPRASYLVIDDRQVTIHRVEYDVEAEVRALRAHKHPQRDWIATILRTARYIPPPAPA
jgi:putative phosphoesterase